MTHTPEHDNPERRAPTPEEIKDLDAAIRRVTYYVEPTEADFVRDEDQPSTVNVKGIEVVISGITRNKHGGIPQTRRVDLQPLDPRTTKLQVVIWPLSGELRTSNRISQVIRHIIDPDLLPSIAYATEVLDIVHTPGSDPNDYTIIRKGGSVSSDNEGVEDSSIMVSEIKMLDSGTYTTITGASCLKLTEEIGKTWVIGES